MNPWIVQVAPRFSATHSVLLVALVGMLLAPACRGCGTEEKQDEEPTDVSAPEPPEEDPLAGAAEEARDRAESAALARSDEARFLAGNIAASEEEDDSSGTRRTANTVDVPAEPEGSLAADKLQKVFRKHNEQTRECYERQLKKNPSLSGRVVVQLTINSDGSVVEAAARGFSLSNESVNDCLEARIREWQFPEPDGGAARVRKPFSFSPKAN